jgi:hypothetical protein
MYKIIITILLISLFIFSCTEEIEVIQHEDGYNDCSPEFGKLYSRYMECNNENYFSYFAAGSSDCNIYSVWKSETVNTCKENLDALSCEEIATINTIDKFEEIDGCLNFPRKTKKEACIENYKIYCVDLLSCGEEALYGICTEYEKLEEKEINCDDNGQNCETYTPIIFDESKFDTYCSIENGENPIIEDDLYIRGCGKSNNIDCNNIQELDFRNNSWKTVCEE